MKAILLPVHADAGQMSRLSVACDLARSLKGKLTCLEMRGAASDDGRSAPPAMLEDAIAVERQTRSQCELQLADQDVPNNWIEGSGSVAASIKHHAALHDLVIVSSPGREGNHCPSDVAAQVVGHVRQPVLAVPHHSRHLHMRHNALVAWDGSLGVEAALRAAIPMLRLARRVTICSVGGSESLEAAIAYCTLHGVHGQPAARRNNEGVAVALLEEIGICNAAYVVMGAYSRSPTREAIFGGVTDALLRHACVPLLLAA